MKAARITPLAVVLTAAFALALSTGAALSPQERRAGINLAVVAQASTSYVSGDTTLAALNDGFDPRSSQDRSHRSYGNWPRRGTQWVQYEWSQPIATDGIDVYWWNDRRGVRTPKACRLLYWDGARFAPVEHASGLGVAESRYNTTTFDEVRTSKLRLEIDSSGRFSTGLLEWKVYDSGNSPPFPPLVAAGVDRVVVLGGRTYLRGEVQALTGEGGAAAKVTWSRASGPGTVTFADANALETSATCSALGDYVLELTAQQGALSASATLALKVIERPPERHLEPIGLRSYAIESPLWFQRAKAIIVHWIPHCIATISDPNLREGGINNFVDAARKLAGQPHGKHRGYVFSNAWVYNTIEAICTALMVDSRGDSEILAAQKAMKATLAEWIPQILAAQEPDGYLQTVFTLSGWKHFSPEHRNAHEGYVAGYFLEAAIAHYLLTKGADDRLYAAARKLADCWERHIGPAPKQEWYDGHQSMEMALVHFGRFVNQVEGGGQGNRFIALAKFLLDCRRNGQRYDQSHVPVVQQYEAVGHAVRASYSYTAMADIALATNDIDYQSAVASLWDSIVNRKYYLTGGIGSGETAEGFGPDYSLRHNAYCESCSSCGEIFFQHRMLLATGEARYADLYEETLYNALLGSLDLAGENFTYTNPLVTVRPRYPWHVCPCCVGNIPRTLLLLPTWTYARSSDSIYVNLFIASRVKIEDVAGTAVEMVQGSDYPWSGAVSITVNPRASAKFSVRIRIPDRSVSALYASEPTVGGLGRIAVNGTPIEPPVKKGYAVLTRTWRAGDTIELTLPMAVQRVKGIDRIAATRGQVALRRGPLVYAFESVDQDLDKVLSPRAPLRAEWKGDLLGGVMVLTGKWADGSALTAIPYYARANRLSGAPPRGARGGAAPRSSVWIRDR